MDFPSASTIASLLVLLWLGITFLILYIVFLKRGSSSFHRACSAGKLEKVQAILQANPGRINEPDRFGVSPAQYAAGWGRLPVLQYLHSKGADINQADAGWTPLALACAAGHQATFDFLIQHNADPNRPGKNGVIYPLHTAVNHGRIQMTQALLEKGANPNQVGEKGITPLHLAAWRGQLALIQLLLEAGADKTAKDAQSFTPRDYCKQERNIEAEKMLEFDPKA